MNREIEFRGISKITNEWVYGSLLLEYYSKTYGNITAICFNENGITKRHPVKLETVGQYTGVKDKNGEKIFEGDILKGTNNYYIDGNFSSVEFYKGSFYVTLEYDLKGMSLSEFETVWVKNGCKGDKDTCLWLNEFEIVGNIYEKDKTKKINKE